VAQIKEEITLGEIVEEKYN